MNKHHGSRSEPKWKTLTHSGPAFPAPPKIPHSLTLKYRREPIPHLSSNAREFAFIYATLLHKDSKDLKDPTTISNFSNDFLSLLPKCWQCRIGKDFRGLDFSDFTRHIAELEEERRGEHLCATERKRRKEKKKVLKEKHAHCVLNGKKEPLAGWMVEPPGIMRRRGEHPENGRIKLRIRPSDVTINCSRYSRSSPAPPPGTSWKRVICDRSVEWVAKYRNNLGVTKYIMLSKASSLKGEEEREKFEAARGLGKIIGRVRARYEPLLCSRDLKELQLAVAVSFIDQFALRIGNEKGPREADTVGCTSLRKEHVTTHRVRTTEGAAGAVDACAWKYFIKFDFLGKDSIRFQNKFEVSPELHAAVASMRHRRKDGRDKLFTIKAQDVNGYLKELGPGLTARVFRTFKASSLFQSSLSSLSNPNWRKRKVNHEAEAVHAYHRATLAVAKICNHKRTLDPEVERRRWRRLEEAVKLREERVEALQAKCKCRKARVREGDGLREKVKEAEEALKKKRLELALSKEVKDYALGTAQSNYIDPRITVAWARRHGIPLAKVWAHNLRLRYTWAADTAEKSFKF